MMTTLLFENVPPASVCSQVIRDSTPAFQCFCPCWRTTLKSQSAICLNYRATLKFCNHHRELRSARGRKPPTVHKRPEATNATGQG
ncbi:hypothetical protein T02_13996 [Trichinella nativa]|uniref:Uncharacterized protein n=1 Tax=Trichinella nativa TaxID=6335 RepID=A0A0V1LM59_9BILA|nr:hypothetical protein T02_13996 [Trichinella nativa]